MIIQEVKKIWYGDDVSHKAKITLRSYVVNMAVRNKDEIKVVHNGRSLVLSVRKLKNPIGCRFFKSKIGKQDYMLLDYKWKPKEL